MLPRNQKLHLNLVCESKKVGINQSVALSVGFNIKHSWYVCQSVLPEKKLRLSLVHK